MIADTAVFSSSPWGSDIFNKDLFMYNQDCKMDPYSLDMDIASLEADLERMKNYNNNNEEMQEMNDNLNSASCSVAGSDYSDEACLDLDPHISNVTGELFAVSEDQEFLNSSLNHLLGGITENSTMLLNWDDEEEEEEEESPSTSQLTENTSTSSSEDMIDIEVDDVIIPSIPSSPCSPRSPSPPPVSSRPVKRRKCCILDDTKLWCEMCDEEQITTVEELSEMISRELGLREQLDVIRIIYPEASISATDTEFVIDLDYLDDSKLQLVRDYIRQHVKSASVCSISCRSCNSPAQKKLTKKQSRERRSQQKELRQRQRKEYRQKMKERRSGLFKKEEVLSLTTTTTTSTTSRDDLDPDGDDIDILD